MREARAACVLEQQSTHDICSCEFVPGDETATHAALAPYSIRTTSERHVASSISLQLDRSAYTDRTVAGRHAGHN